MSDFHPKGKISFLFPKHLISAIQFSLFVIVEENESIEQDYIGIRVVNEPI